LVVAGGRTSSLLAALALVSAVVPATAQARRHRVPRLLKVRCVPPTTPSCRGGVRVTIGRQLQLSGRRLYGGMRVAFRWSRGAIATRVIHSRVGYVARVPAGTAPGTVSITVRDRAGRRSNALRVRVLPVRRIGGPPAARGVLPDAFTGNGMWIWQLANSDGGDPVAIAARAHAAGVSTVFVKSSDGTTQWAQFNPALVQALHANGMRACAWQYVYGSDPTGEASLGTNAVLDGADCLVIDAEKQYEGRYAAAQQYIQALRAAIGPSYPLGLTSYPYVDYHPRLPYSVFLGPGGAQANLPQVYWKAIGGTVDAVSAHTLAHNRLYGAAIAPLGQTYDEPPPEDIERFRSLWSGYGSRGMSWWSWQSTGPDGWAALTAPIAPFPPPDPGWPALAAGSKGDEVVWLQQHLESFDPAVLPTATFDAATDLAVRNLQAAHGLPVTGATDPLSWQAVLALPLQPVAWTAAGRPTGGAKSPAETSAARAPG
jgi:peptidoglycan hydrolase-like protein with peptidoglycan-binding domain